MADSNTPTTGGGGIPASRRARRGQPRFGLISATTPSDAVATFHEQSRRNFQATAVQRKKTLRRLARRVAHTSYIIFFVVFIIAGLMDLVGLLKLSVEAIPYLGAIVGFIANVITTPITLVCVTVPMILAQYRVRRINENTKRVQQYTVQLSNQAAQFHKDMLPVMREMRRPYLAAITDPHGMGGVGEFVKYRSRILLNNLLVLILESIPYVDAGPWQTLKVWRVYVHQQKEFRQARIMLLGAQAISQRVEILERFYLEYVEFAFYRNLAREVGVEDQIQPRRPLSERLYATAQRMTPKPKPEPFPNAPPPTMQDIALATSR